MSITYPACFFKEENGYSVIFSDLNDLSTCDETFKGAMKMATDCLAGYLYLAKWDGEDIPLPSKQEKIDPDAIAKRIGFEPGPSLIIPITVDVDDYANIYFKSQLNQ